MKTPSLRKHATGQYFVHWGGRDHYLGHDRDEAESLYMEELQAWQDWRQQRRTTKDRQRRRSRLAVAELVQAFLSAKRAEVGEQAEWDYKKRLAKFTHTYGLLDADLIRPTHLNAHKLDMLNQGYANRTINQFIVAVRVMFNWASGIDMVEPINLAGVKALPVGPVDDKTVSEQRIFRAMMDAPHELKPWMAINYFALLRPSEVVKVARGEGQWIDEGIFRLDRGKMDRRASIKRHCIFSPVAMKWVERCEPHWSRLDSYSSAVRRTFPDGPKILQKSAATHLVHHHGATPDEVELLLGHVKGRLGVTYYLPAFRRLREVSGRLLTRSVS